MRLWIPAALVLVSCSSEPPPVEEAQRRELLTPIDVETKRAERLEQARVLDEDGIPIPSDMQLAGIDIPKSFELVESRERRWVLRSTRVSPEALARYMELRVFTGSLERKAGGGLRIMNAQLKNALEEPRVTLTISPVRGSPHHSRLRIEQAAPLTVVERKSQAEVEAQMRVQRLHAD